MRCLLRQSTFVVLTLLFALESCFILEIVAQSSDDITFQPSNITYSTLRSSILEDIQAFKASCTPKDTCRIDKVSDFQHKFASV